MTNQYSFSERQVDAVWRKGLTVNGNDPNTYRKDVCGAWMTRNQHGNTDHIFGWEIDHITPTAHNGSNDLYNLQPLQWKNNRQKGDGSLKCNIKAYTKDGKEINVEWMICQNCAVKGFVKDLHLSNIRCHSCNNVIPL